MHFLVSALITSLATAALSSAASTGTAATATVTRRHLSFNPDPAVVASIDVVNGVEDITARSSEPLTNAKRFAVGLPPLTPRRRASVPRTPASSPCPPVPVKCNVHAISTSGTDFGWLSPVWNGFGEYGQFQSSADGALQLSFSYSPDSPHEISITATNSPSATYPFFGAIDGFASTDDNFGAGNYNYAYIGGTGQTPAGAVPEGGDNSFSAATGIPESVESAVWSYDPVTHELTAQWVNTDGSKPATHIVYANDSNQALALTGDVGAFQSTFGVPYPEVRMMCVPVQEAPKPRAFAAI